jgi:hypothetical protein
MDTRFRGYDILKRTLTYIDDTNVGGPILFACHHVNAVIFHYFKLTLLVIPA